MRSRSETASRAGPDATAPQHYQEPHRVGNGIVFFDADVRGNGQRSRAASRGRRLALAAVVLVVAMSGVGAVIAFDWFSLDSVAGFARAGAR